MLFFVFLVGCFICIAIIGDNKSGNKLLQSYTWIKYVPTVTLVLGVLFLGESIIFSVPQGENFTKLVKVSDCYSGEEYYWNLKIDVTKDAIESNDSYIEYDVYTVNGYISPQTGQLVKVESYSYESFEDDCEFFEYIESEDGETYELKYETAVKKTDVDVTLDNKLKAISPLNIIIYLLLLVGALVAEIIVIKKYLFSQESSS
ncbi:hypothetical protein [Butyrivibrio sp. AE3006]|uniref:hypothetical protein n=1 Tax=Butyrivibrio sp. AE3006 TaxID=1280673 RepID=UPI0004258C7B|nr:hypothetical protein [Butyrivibrio sp. AE3006]